jgi:cysteine desulfurase
MTAVIYLDHNATTPLDPRVLDRMMPWLTGPPLNGVVGNPHARGHGPGRLAAAAVERARTEVAALIGAAAPDIVFTSGATEANNLAITGLARARRRLGFDHVVTAATEHPSVLGPCRRLEAEDGFRLTVLPVLPDGRLDPALLEAALTPGTALVSIMAANHETGTVKGLADLAAACRARGVPFHSDAAQAAGKIPLGCTGLDALTLSAHKLHGPAGIGALWLRRTLGVVPEPLMRGGGQERGLRPGTVPVSLCVGFGAACALAAAERDGEAARLAALRDRLQDRLARGLPGLRVNGGAAPRLPGTLNVSIPGLDAEALMLDLPGLALASGAACAWGADGPSPGLLALGLDRDLAASSLRFGLGRATTAAEIDQAAALVLDRAAAQGLT